MLCFVLELPPFVSSWKGISEKMSPKWFIYAVNRLPSTSHGLMKGGLDHLLDRRLPPGRMPFLTEEQQQEIRQLVLTITPVDVGGGISSS
ncbi:putative transposase (plasmid) [Anoxybacillus amylolyticus]|uniref:Putative transposase n=1 Tax=Anoxybacteroides amylolyticum TaxID=294699 RepID=A0A160F7S6_9BACL|nr:putative transposase [Anoxybacillus amylolyticus]